MWCRTATGGQLMPVPYLSRIENYKAGVPIANLARIAEALRKSDSYF